MIKTFATFTWSRLLKNRIVYANNGSSYILMAFRVKRTDLARILNSELCKAGTWVSQGDYLYRLAPHCLYIYPLKEITRVGFLFLAWFIFRILYYKWKNKILMGNTCCLHVRLPFITFDSFDLDSNSNSNLAWWWYSSANNTVFLIKNIKTNSSPPTSILKY